MSEQASSVSRVILMRHGDAAFISGAGADRQLTDRGRAEAMSVGHQLKQLDIAIDSIWVSPLDRAQQTLHLLNVNCESVAVEDAISPSGNPLHIAKRIFECQSPVLLVVSHMPVIAELAGYLMHGNFFQPEPFQTAQAMVLKTDVASEGCYHLEKKILPIL